MTFSALGVVFNMHRNIATKIFQSTLRHLDVPQQIMFFEQIKQMLKVPCQNVFLKITATPES